MGRTKRRLRIGPLVLVSAAMLSGVIAAVISAVGPAEAVPSVGWPGGQVDDRFEYVEVPINGMNFANNNPLIYSATGLPAGVTINPTTGIMSGTITAPLGTYSVDLEVSDGLDAVQETIQWVVNLPTDYTCINATRCEGRLVDRPPPAGWKAASRIDSWVRLDRARSGGVASSRQRWRSDDWGRMTWQRRSDQVESGRRLPSASGPTKLGGVRPKAALP